MHPLFLSRALAYLGFGGFAALSLGSASAPSAEVSPPQEQQQHEGADAAQCIDEQQSADELASCVSWDIKELCCPGYCAAKNGSNWSSADKIFNACIMSIGCKSGYTSGFMSCSCPKN